MRTLLNAAWGREVRQQLIEERIRKTPADLGNNYWLTRLVLQRGLALVYLIAFVAVIHQFEPLLAEHGLLPVSQFIAIYSLHWPCKGSRESGTAV